ncbi:MAG: N-acetylmuramoyl-L-alanine amidase [Hyphomicrobiaceae bacterium]|jgi:N-acetylmuramoyl-L-alanine amidase
MSSQTSVTIIAIAAVLSVAQLPGQEVRWFRDRNLTRVAPTHATLAAAMQHLCAGPSASATAQGCISHLPSHTRCLAATIQANTANIVLTDHLLASPNIEDAIEQIDKTALAAPGVHRVAIYIEDANGLRRELGMVLKQGLVPVASAGGSSTPTTLVASFGSLQGKRIAVSPGHGYYWHSSLGWTTQRGVIDGLVEDIHTAEISNRYLIPLLQNMGADIVMCREHGERDVDAIIDNDVGAPAYSETGGWSTSASSGYQNSGYRFATTNSSTESATAHWQIPITKDGLYPVFAWFRASGNRTPEANYRVHHSGGTETVVVDQTRDNLTWAHLGNFWFAAATGAHIELSNFSPSPGVVIADAMRLGGGVGSIQRGGATSNQARWRECARYWTQFAGAPSSIYNSVSTGQDNSDDVTARPRFAEWRGADAFLSVHTNAGGGAGTSTFTYSGGATAGSTSLSNAVHTQIISDLRSQWDPSWTDRGQLQANFGELRLLSSMPGILVELAFHDTPGSSDMQSLHDPKWRYLVARAYARGVLRYFSPLASFPPEAPPALRIEQDGARGLRIAWDPASGATHYTIEQSQDGKGFLEVADVAANSWSTGPLPHHAWASYRVRAWNASGRSFPTEVLTAGTDHLATAQVLLVQGFDRLGRTVKGPENTRDYLHRLGDSCRRAANFSFGFDAASNEAVQFGRVTLSDYDAVVWSLGEESTVDESFSNLEQLLVSNYLNSGGSLLVSGAEAGWDLDAQGTTSDRAFFRNILGATYVADDANTYSLQAGVPGTLSDGIAASSFDDGTGPTYNVDYADVLAPSNANGQVCLRYGNGLGAGVQMHNPLTDARTAIFGLPLAAMLSDSARAQLLQQSLLFLLDEQSLSGPSIATLGQATSLNLAMSGEAGFPYLVAISEGIQSGALLPLGSLFPLDVGPILQASITPGSPFFVDFTGTLDANGEATATLVLPNLPFLNGLPLYAAAFTMSATFPIERKLSNWIRLTLSL